MKLLIFLQNAWGVEDGYVPDFSRESFRKSQTGKRLSEALPDGDVCIKIRNCSPIVGDVSSSNYEPDMDYVNKQIRSIQPDVILACGVNAREAMSMLELNTPVVYMPHPAYRALSKQITKNTKMKLNRLIRTIDKAS